MPSHKRCIACSLFAPMPPAATPGLVTMEAIPEKPRMNAPLHKQMPRAALDDARAPEHANAQMMVCGAAMQNAWLAGHVSA